MCGSEWKRRMRNESAGDRGDGHERPGTEPGGDREQHRQHQHHRLQTLARRIHRPHLSDRASHGGLQPWPRRDHSRRRADRPRRSHRRDSQRQHPGRSDQHRQHSRSGDQRPRLVPGDDAERRHRLHPRRRVQHQRQRPARHHGRLHRDAADSHSPDGDGGHRQPDRAGDRRRFRARRRRSSSAS